MPKFYYVKQRSREWYNLRRGIPTASNFHRICTATGRLSAQSPLYMAGLLAEKFTGHVDEEVQTEYMQIGVVQEGQAVAAYELDTNYETTEIGFVTLDDGSVGCSPDRLIAGDGGLELKCPKGATHFLSMLNRSIDEKHKPQVQGSLWICERDWWDVFSYLPETAHVIVRAHRDEEYIKNLKTSLEAFNETMAKAAEKLQQEYKLELYRPEEKAAVAQEIYDQWENTL